MAFNFSFRVIQRDFVAHYKHTNATQKLWEWILVREMCLFPLSLCLILSLHLLSVKSTGFCHMFFFYCCYCYSACYQDMTSIYFVMVNRYRSTIHLKIVYVTLKYVQIYTYICFCNGSKLWTEISSWQHPYRAIIICYIFSRWQSIVQLNWERGGMLTFSFFKCVILFMFNTCFPFFVCLHPVSIPFDCVSLRHFQYWQQ